MTTVPNAEDHWLKKFPRLITCGSNLDIFAAIKEKFGKGHATHPNEGEWVVPEDGWKPEPAELEANHGMLPPVDDCNC